MKLLSRMKRTFAREMDYLIGQVDRGNTMALFITICMVFGILSLGFWMISFLGIDVRDPKVIAYEEDRIAGCRTLPENLQEDCLWGLKAEGIDID